MSFYPKWEIICTPLYNFRPKKLPIKLIISTECEIYKTHKYPVVEMKEVMKIKSFIYRSTQFCFKLVERPDVKSNMRSVCMLTNFLLTGIRRWGELVISTSCPSFVFNFVTVAGIHCRCLFFHSILLGWQKWCYFVIFLIFL